MTQEDKELLLKDLCSRLPYEVKCIIDEMYLTGDMIKGGYDKIQELYGITYEGNVELLNMDYHMPIESIKPYLFPLSSMTDEQRKEYEGIIYKNIELHCERYYDVIDVDDFDCLIDFYHKNHLDYRGLIRLGLALDATNLNIY